MKISRAELRNKYGIDLPKGLYRIKAKDGYYTINSVKDDTEGCVLTGERHEKYPYMLKGGSSVPAFKKLYNILKSAREKIVIEITSTWI